MKYLLDTSTCIFFLRGESRIDNTIRKFGLAKCSISEISVLELRYGAENSMFPRRSHSAVNSFLEGIYIIDIGGIEKQYAETKVSLRKKGTPMHDEFDLLIGVTALFYGLTLVTDNVKDFRFIEGLKIENWIARK